MPNPFQMSLATSLDHVPGNLPSHPGATAIQCACRLCFFCAMLQLSGNNRRSINVILPFEIMARIFWFSLPQYTSADFRVENRKQMMRRAGPLLLGAVCIAWRNIAWQTPALWTSMTVYLFPKIIQFPEVFIDEWFGRAGNRPLDLCVYSYPERNDRVEGAVSERSIYLLMNCVRGYIHQSRLRSLSLHLPWLHAALPGEIFHSFGGHTSSSMHLDHLLLETAKGWTGYFPLFLPSIKKLVLRGKIEIDKVHARWSFLDTLHLSTDDLDVGEALLLLWEAFNLVECSIKVSWFFYPNTSVPMPNTPIIHTNLTRLEIEQDEVFSGPFFENLILPSLDFLRVSRAVFNEQKVNAFASFLTSSGRIRELILERVSGLENNVLINILRLTPSIETLRLSTDFRRLYPVWPVCDSFLQAVAKFPCDSLYYTGNEPLLPLLQVIDLEGGCSFSWAFVCYLLHSRLRLPTWKTSDYLGHEYRTLQSFRMKVHDPCFPTRYQSIPEDAEAHLRRAVDMGLLVDISYFGA